MIQAVARRVLNILGWTLRDNDPGTGRYVLIVAPHTSNWDFILGLLAGWAFDLHASWMGKHTLFRFPLGGFFRLLGGIPVDRTAAGNVIDEVASRFAATDYLVLGIAPEGTRSHRRHWKSGFWHIARAAEVPIMMAAIDYGSKTISMSQPFLPGDDIEADFVLIRNFYAGKTGKHPGLAGDIRPRIQPSSSATPQV